jgi:PAS domain S-box-containing protein
MTSINFSVAQFSSNDSFYARIFEDAPFGIATVTADGTITSANPYFCRLLGYSPHELCQLTIKDISHPDDMPNEISLIRDMVEKHLPNVTFEKRYRTKDGNYVWTELVTSSIYNPNGELLFGLGMVVEITKRKQFEIALKESEERYRSLYSQSPIAIEYYDTNGKLVDVNDSCMKLFGIEDKYELVGFDLFADPNLPDKSKENLKNGHIVRYQEEFDFEKVIEKKLYRTNKRGTIWIDVSIKPITLHNGYLVQIQNITSQKLAEMKLAESEARWQFALDGANEGVWDWDASTNRVYYSPHWKSMLGFSDDEIGNTLAEWDSRIHPDDKEVAYADLEKHFNGDTPEYKNEHRIRCKDGSYKWILDRGKVIERKADGSPLRVIGTHSDITERKEHESEREKLISELNVALANVKKLSGLLPICSHCKKIRDDKGYWNQIESYIHRHSEADFSHSICPECAKKHYPDFDIYED